MPEVVDEVTECHMSVADRLRPLTSYYPNYRSAPCP
jgi:hypothetical protein